MPKNDSHAVAELLPLRRSQSDLPAPESDELLVLSLRARHPDAGTQLFDRYAPHVRRVLVRVMGPDSEILDLVHDVFVTALESVHRLLDPKALRAWLTQVAVFTARARIRRRVRGRILRFLPFSELPEPELPPADFEASEAMQAVYRVLASLDTDQRIAFALRFVAGMELTEVAASCGVSLATIKRRLSRAQTKLSQAARLEPALADRLEPRARRAGRRRLVSALAERLQRLGREVAAEQNRALTQDLSLGSVRARVIGKPLRRAKRPQLWAGLAVGTALAAGAAIYGVARPQVPLAASFGDRPLAVGEWVSATEPGTPHIRFSDGSEVALSPGSRARLATLDAVGAHLVLESGAADVRVTPNHGARYRVSLGPFAVDVTGTRFDVGFRPSDELFTLTLHEGKVVVSGCVLGEGRTLLAGESLSASCRAGHFEISATGASSAAQPAAPPSAQVPPESPTGTADAEPEPLPTPDHAAGLARENAVAPPSWQTLARQSRFNDAFALVDAEGFDTAVSAASLTELALLGDIARFAGKPADALTAYQALRSRGAGSAAAKQAAFSIARVHFDQRAAYAEAARWFRTYLAEQPGGPLAREAEGRLMEALSRAGDRAGARRAAEGYLAKYPHGPHERVARQLLAR